MVSRRAAPARGLVAVSLLLSLATVTAGCGGSAPVTEAVITVDAEPNVLLRTAELHMLVEGGLAFGDPTEVIHSRLLTPGQGGDPGFPFTVVLHPRYGETTRRWALTLEAYAMDGTERILLVRLRQVGGYVAGQTLAVRMVLEDACVGVECPGGQVCSMGECVPVDDCVGVVCGAEEVCRLQCANGSGCRPGACEPAGQARGNIVPCVSALDDCPSGEVCHASYYSSQAFCRVPCTGAAPDGGAQPPLDDDRCATQMDALSICFTPGGSTFNPAAETLPTYVCSNGCDPFEDGCPEGAACTIVDAYFDGVSRFAFDCATPVDDPGSQGELCRPQNPGYTPTGCAAGYVCTWGRVEAEPSGSDYVCQRLCDPSGVAGPGCDVGYACLGFSSSSPGIALYGRCVPS